MNFKEYIASFVFIVLLSAILGALGFALVVGFIYLLFTLFVKFGFGIMIVVAGLGLVALLSFVAWLITKILQKGKA